MATQKTSRKVPAPGYETDKPLFPAISKLNEELGLQDSAIQLSELAIQVLAEQAKSSKLGASKYLTEEFRSRGISHGTHDFSHLSSFSHGTFIVQTYGAIEAILKGLAREYRQHKWIPDDRWISKDDDGESMSPLATLIANLPPADARLVRNKPEVDLIEYYRALRVSIVHPSKETRAKAAAAFDKIAKHMDTKDYFRDTYKRDAPNGPDAVSFDDFRLFTRSFKYLANILNQACNLSPQEIADYIRCRDPDIVRGNPKKLSSLRTYAKFVYGERADGLAEIDDATVEFLKLRAKVARAIQKRNSTDEKQFWQVVAQRNNQFALTVSGRKRKKGPDDTRHLSDLSFEEVMEQLASE